MSVEFFSRSPLLAGIAPDDLKALVRYAEERLFLPGHHLFQRGDPGDGVFAIVSGHVKVFLQGTDGGEVIVATRTTGDVLGELSLLDDHRRSASAAAMDDVRTLRIGKDHFQEWLANHPAAATAMLKELAARVRDTTDQVAEIALLSIDARIARRLWQLFREAARGGEPYTGMRLRVNQSDLAAFVGVTRESVNKHLAKMKSTGVIAIESGKVELLKPPELRMIAQEL
jgi:CRP-like cAMP-binding protein